MLTVLEASRPNSRALGQQNLLATVRIELIRVLDVKTAAMTAAPRTSLTPNRTSQRAVRGLG
jgi:hypothetical protein